jgi:hypothetical protein
MSWIAYADALDVLHGVCTCLLTFLLSKESIADRKMGFRKYHSSKTGSHLAMQRTRAT